jgi:hypothetical protein
VDIGPNVLIPTREIRKTGSTDMASDDARVPPEPAAQQSGLRNCDHCNAAMTQLGELPALSIHPAIKVYRCYACDRVVTERS